MSENDNARPGRHPGAGASSTTRCLADRPQLTPDREARQQARRIHALGPRPIHEMLDEIRHDPVRAPEIIDRYANMDPDRVAFFGGRDWLEPHHLLRAVRP